MPNVRQRRDRDRSARGDGSTASEDDALIYCDFSPLPEEIGRRATRALESVAAALRGGDSEFERPTRAHLAPIDPTLPVARRTPFSR